MNAKLSQAALIYPEKALQSSRSVQRNFTALSLNLQSIISDNCAVFSLLLDVIWRQVSKALELNRTESPNSSSDFHSLFRGLQPLMTLALLSHYLFF